MIFNNAATRRRYSGKLVREFSTQLFSSLLPFRVRPESIVKEFNYFPLKSSLIRKQRKRLISLRTNVSSRAFSQHGFQISCFEEVFLMRLFFSCFSSNALGSD
jgi:hypothetical protein